MRSREEGAFFGRTPDTLAGRRMRLVERDHVTAPKHGSSVSKKIREAPGEVNMSEIQPKLKLKRRRLCSAASVLELCGSVKTERTDRTEEKPERTDRTEEKPERTDRTEGARGQAVGEKRQAERPFHAPVSSSVSAVPQNFVLAAVPDLTSVPVSSSVPAPVPAPASSFSSGPVPVSPHTFAPVTAPVPAPVPAPDSSLSGSHSLWALTLAWLLQDTSGPVPELPHPSAKEISSCPATTVWALTQDVPPFPLFSSSVQSCPECPCPDIPHSSAHVMPIHQQQRDTCAPRRETEGRTERTVDGTKRTAVTMKRIDKKVGTVRRTTVGIVGTMTTVGK
ncbi:hypothetical protein WMY93_027080 [Mugilogobius chulae]|uniref:Uncharacterized protein n=1 Tax=Mugilogobius chulae TaxID=88201 RepID=A0AAW0MWB2_9GOBI